jgi:2-polyprenyl-3-methyl-5-hydroxy-6-metoxy-1,4-benzoquinol methylase
MSLAVRSTAAELMDEAGLDETIYQRCLRDLAAVNRVTRTHAYTLRWLRRASAEIPPGRAIAVLDLAYGQGDLLRAIARWAAQSGRRVMLSGIDLNPRSAIAARATTPAGMEIDYRTGDVFAYEPAEPVDFIVSSQFAHHLTDAQIIRLLRWCEATAARGWLIVDLHRHAIPYYGFRLLCRLMSWHRIVRYDGTVSIARGFTRAEWADLLARAGIDATISWHALFRHGISRLK